jgi:hypothetical protein
LKFHLWLSDRPAAVDQPSLTQTSGHVDFRQKFDIPAESGPLRFVGAIWWIIADGVSEVLNDARISQLRKSISCMIPGRC